MDAKDTYERINGVIRRLSYLLNSLEDEFDCDSLEISIQDLEELSDDIQEAEDKRLAAIGCGELALCIWCGERFRHGAPHPCKQMVLRGSVRDD